MGLTWNFWFNLESKPKTHFISPLTSHAPNPNEKKIWNGGSQILNVLFVISPTPATPGACQDQEHVLDQPMQDQYGTSKTYRFRMKLIPWVSFYHTYENIQWNINIDYPTYSL